MDLGSTLPPPQLQPSRRGVSASFRFKKNYPTFGYVWSKSEFKFAPSRPAIKIQTAMLPDNLKVERVWEKQRLWRWTWMDLYICIMANVKHIGSIQIIQFDFDVRANIVTQCTCKTMGMGHVMACVIYGISFITHNHNLALQRAPCCSM